MAQSVLRTSGASMTALFSPNPLMSLLRDWLILPLLRLPVVSRALVSRTSQLDVNYRASALSAGRGRGGRVRAGDRAPDASCQDVATGGPVRLDVLRGTHFTLLQFGPATPSLPTGCSGGSGMSSVSAGWFATVTLRPGDQGGSCAIAPVAHTAGTAQAVARCCWSAPTATWACGPGRTKATRWSTI